MGRSLVGFATASLAFAATLAMSPAALAADQLLAGRLAVVSIEGNFRKSGARFTIEAPAIDIPGDPTVVGATLEIFDTGGAGGSEVFDLPAGGWKRVPTNTNRPLEQYEYHGAKNVDDPCNFVVVRQAGEPGPDVVKAFCKDGLDFTPPFDGQIAIILTIGDTRYCASFGGSTLKNTDKRTSRRNAPPPAACGVPGGGTTSTSTPEPSTTSTSAPGASTTSTSTPEGSTTSTSAPEGSTTSTSAPEGSTTSTSTPEGSTTSTSAPGGSTTSTSTPEGSTTSTSAPGGSTTSTSTPEGSTTSTSAPEGSTTSTSTPVSSTTSTTGGGELCCNGATFVSFLTGNLPGDCGDIIDATGAVVRNIACAGLFTGGGGNTVPLPFAVPDLGQAVSAITECTGQDATLGGATSAETASNRNCTSTGCLFGAPLAVPNPGSTPTSVCVLNTATQPLTGDANCETGATTAVLPLASEIFLSGDTLGEAGIQPCPKCTGTPGSETCQGGSAPANTPCVPGTTALNAAYPTSHDCPPVASLSIGTIPIAFELTSGTVTWSGTTATNDPDSTVANMPRIFAGFCRDKQLPGATGAFQNPAKQCWQNTMAFGTPCDGVGTTFETCEQRTEGAFGPDGGATRTITAIGNASGLLGSGEGAATLVSIFAIPPTFNATVDGAGDLPGPGAVALPGTATLCTTANPCP